MWKRVHWFFYIQTVTKRRSVTSKGDQQYSCDTTEHGAAHKTYVDSGEILKWLADLYTVKYGI